MSLLVTATNGIQRWDGYNKGPNQGEVHSGQFIPKRKLMFNERTELKNNFVGQHSDFENEPSPDHMLQY